MSSTMTTTEQPPPPPYEKTEEVATAVVETTATTAQQPAPEKAATAVAAAAAAAAAAVNANVLSPDFADAVEYGNSKGDRIFYKKATQEYWVVAPTSTPQQTAAPAPVLFLQVPKQVITKDQGKKFFKGCTSFDDVCNKIPKSFPGIKPSQDESVVPTTLIYVNAVHDSIIVKRNIGETSLVAFYFTKRLLGQVDQRNLIVMFRAEHVSQCPVLCSTLEMCGAVVYCKACTTYRLQVANPAGGVLYHYLGRVGTLSIEFPTACEIMRAMCPNNRLNTSLAVPILGSMFLMFKFQNVPLPYEQTIYWTLRDSLFVPWDATNKSSWYDQFYLQQPGAQANAGMAGAAAAIGIARLGLAIATLGMVS